MSEDQLYDPDSFKWSHSRLAAYETCPRRHQEVDLLKRFVEAPSAAMQFGSDVHKALELFCRDGTPIPAALRTYQEVADTVVALPGDKFYELKLGLRRDFSPCEFFDPKVWFRCVVDVLTITGDKGLVVDYKTGKKKDDKAQLLLNAAAIFAHFPEVDKLAVAFWWITKDRSLTPAKYERADLPSIWSKFLPRVQRYEKAVKDDRFFPNPSGLCRNYCPVKTCTFHGK